MRACVQGSRRTVVSRCTLRFHGTCAAPCDKLNAQCYSSRLDSLLWTWCAIFMGLMCIVRVVVVVVVRAVRERVVPAYYEVLVCSKV